MATGLDRLSVGSLSAPDIYLPIRILEICILRNLFDSSSSKFRRSWIWSETFSVRPVILTPLMELMTSVVMPTRFCIACIQALCRGGTSLPTCIEMRPQTDSLANDCVGTWKPGMKLTNSQNNRSNAYSSKLNPKNPQRDRYL